MPRAIWTGSVSFGLVNVPVRLYSAVSSKGVRFHEVEEGTGARIRHRRVSEETGEEVPYERIRKGYDLGGGRLVVVDPDELDGVSPESTRVIEVGDFVDIQDIDPVHFASTYWLAPGGRGAEKPYRLLVDVLADSGKVGLARFVMRTKQYLAALRSRNGVLALETMHFADEIVDPASIDGLPVDAELSERERAAAAKLVDSLTTGWDPEAYEDTYREQVLELIERKARGDAVVAAPSRPDEPAEVVDLMAALEASVAEGRRRSAPSRGGAALDGLTKDQLYERAQDAGIEGRSRMSKEELVDALRRAS